MKVSQSVLEVLDRCQADGNALRLPPQQLERKLYVAVNEVLEAAGGKWNRKAKAHLFADDASGTIEPIILTGEFEKDTRKQDFGQFDTPMPLARRMAVAGGVGRGTKVIEPSCGTGRLAWAAKELGGVVFAYEIDEARAEASRQIPGLYVVTGDFLLHEPASEGSKYDLALMNPPFAKRADVLHVLHAAKFVRPGGRVVAIMSPGFTFRQSKMDFGFRAFLEANEAEIEQLPAGSFKESGTMVNAVLVSFDLLVAP